MTFEPRQAIVPASPGELAVDGGMRQMGPQAGSHLTTGDWRTV